MDEVVEGGVPAVAPVHEVMGVNPQMCIVRLHLACCSPVHVVDGNNASSPECGERRLPHRAPLPGGPSRSVTADGNDQAGLDDG